MLVYLELLSILAIGILLISTQVLWLYNLPSKSQFQDFVLGCIRSATIPLRRLCSLKIWSGVWNQSGWLREIWWPDPTNHLPFPNSANWGFAIFFQVHEWLGLGMYPYRWVLGKYFALKVLARSESGEFCILQNCFVSIAWKVLNFLKPRENY